MKPQKQPYVAKQPDASGVVPYSDEENEIWHILITRQKEIVKARACQEYLDGLKHLALPEDHVPQCHEINKKLQEATGWSVSPVNALIPVEEFFTLLANRKFPAATFVRHRDELDYLQEPDIFHEFFGHCPMLTNQTYADFMQRYGEVALKASEHDRNMLGRLYWFTVEFGLIKTSNGALCYGGGILSSKEETIYSVESNVPERKPWNTVDALRTPYRIDIKQPIYFVINDFEQLYRLVHENIHDEIRQADALGEFPPQFEPLEEKK